MSKKMAFLFAIAGTFFLTCIGIAISFHQPWLIVLSIVLTVLQIGLGFVVKARVMRKQQNSRP